MKPIQLNRLGLKELSGESLLVINGGATPPANGKILKWFKRLSWAAIAKDAFDHWDEIKKGFSDGWDIK